MRASRCTAVLLTGMELRHDFVRMAIALNPAIHLLATFQERKKTLFDSLPKQPINAEACSLHLQERQRSEEDYFGAFVQLSPDLSSPITIDLGGINSDPHVRAKLRELNPDVLICYGTSLIREPVLSDFNGRFLNIHLGLSPYYRGGGTNFWPFVNGEPEFVGVTFMHIDAGVDTGHIVHQMRARIYPEDNIHSIGNRLIRDMAITAPSVAFNLQRLPRVNQASSYFHKEVARVYRRKDFNGSVVLQAKARIDAGLLTGYLEERQARDAKAPIVQAEHLLS